MKKNILTLIYTSIFTAFFVSIFPFSLIAQSSLGTQILVSPSQLGANEEFSVSLISTETDLNRANISWYLNGRLGLSGVGKDGFSIITGAVGTYFKITAVIEKPEGGTITKKTTVRPEEVDILWQAYSSVPPFYKGKALAPSAGLVQLTAIPNLIDQNGKKLNPNDLVYTWSQRGVVLGNASGYGKQSIVLENGQIPERLLNVSVSVSSFDKVISARKDINVPLSESKIIFYKKHPLEGLIYNKNIRNNFIIDDSEIEIFAEPYYFSLDDIIKNQVTYRWKVNNKDINIPLNEQGKSITFKKEGDSGLAKVSLEIRNTNIPFRIFQSAEKTVNIEIK